MHKQSVLRRLLFIMMTGSFFFSLHAQDTQNITFWTNMDNAQLADALIAQMSDEELFAQILMFGWAGTEPSPLLLDWIQTRSLGSVKVYGWNTDNIISVASSVSQTQKLSQNNRFQIPLFVATDQEGGWIRHIKGSTSDTPGNLAIGASGYPIDAYLSGYYIAKELRALGINMNFAPTVDLYTNLDSTVIGPRSFGEYPYETAVFGSAFAAGSMKAGVIPTAKHFPGHGDTSDDSHGGLPQITASKKTLEERELVPFKYLVEQKIPAIMSGHLSFPNITQKGEPASLSRFFLTELLRGEMGYEGLIITDDMMMNGATMYAGGLSVAVYMAIEAGNDIVISSTTALLNDPLWRNNLALMKTDKEFRSLIQKAAHRVILSKLDYFKGGNAVPLYPDIDAIPSLVPDPEGQSFFLEQACRSITLYKKGLFPYKTGIISQGDSAVSIENNERVLLTGHYDSFFSYGKESYPDSGFYKVSAAMGPNETAYTEKYLPELAKNYDTVIMCVSDEQDVRVARALAKTKVRLIILSIMSPVHIKDVEADTILLAYSYSPYSFQAAFAALRGDFVPQGVLPLEFQD